ncbi:50S ribosomal protein L11 methyltransferase [Chitinophaga nivalis]|uniref:Ribosomal protein L11 methyltransferase n=1 Tax=Chitinophaga nivalis TaxID=2991709 RepID=A0ABT3IG08_9BACT|nr:50S ribosomal protein L11 methyltransferase [Chitinophaga nivalis]MCW3467417.1 50S ribosomal protein L11 methyltransferase [Chitinophaga nivalis]MCW3482891.1 50S ribosomal protein L11 methyltransferase [Chitinophaga nivalis]
MSHIAITMRAGAEQTDLLIALLSAVGFEGFEEQTDVLIGYIPEADYNEATLESVLQPYGITYTKDAIVPVNWNAVWESNFQPVQVDDFCGIRAAFHPPFTPKPVYEIVITPKMAFGTGHHATTSSMIKLMETLPVAGKSVFDFGTGTGILAILAEMMGATTADAIDYDEWAVNNTLENIADNNMHVVKVWQADNLEAVTRRYDILLANINCNILLRFMADMRRLLEPGGKLLLSGIMPSDEAQILAAALPHGFTAEKRIEKDNWLALQLGVPVA